MKKFSALSILMLAAIFVSAQTITVNKKGLTINKVNVSASWQLSDFKGTLGAPERERDGYNKTHTYDAKGLVVFETLKDKVTTGTVSEFQVHYNVPTPNEVTPKGTFSGTFTFNKLKLNSSVSYADLLNNVDGWEKTDSYMEHSYRYAAYGIYLYFQFNDDETSLLKVSIGPDKRK